MRCKSPLLLTTATALLLSACSAQKSEDATPPAADAASSSNEAGPAISGAVAPGVAFAYNYSFLLPAKAISDVQQQHAQACSRLGTTRCRVTGMNYEQPREGEVAARIDFLLAPDSAHQFGSEGIKAIEAAEGKLDKAQITGENAGDAIKLSQTDSAAKQAEVTRIEARLAAKGLTSAERVELQQQIAALREQLRGAAQDRKVKEASIATTPVSFAYSSDGLLSGNGSTFGKAASASLSSAGAALSFLALVAGIALPWVGLIALAVLGWRWLRRKAVPVEPTPSQ
ncbi:DUF4349 domain-containing protein [Novosphingobium sp. B 225]|uniref:DUF4349 domain-containing protein n=1 Tax=Novosphingobium sp. B 225 TaxID=1961849 RepID=UPI000B4B1324|nr:DUF4349 domain-containing protein [Novosphingobium sp. B 225]